MQESERPIKDSAESMMGSGRKSLPISSGGSGGLRDSGSQYRSGSGGIRGIMENLSQHQDVTGQVRMLSMLLCCAPCAHSRADAEAALILTRQVTSWHANRSCVCWALIMHPCHSAWDAWEEPGCVA